MTTRRKTTSWANWVLNNNKLTIPYTILIQTERDLFGLKLAILDSKSAYDYFFRRHKAFLVGGMP